MSVPHGAPHPAPKQPTPPGGKAGGHGLTFILTCAAGAAGVLGYLLGFFSPEASALIGGLPGFSLVAAAVLAGMRLLPKAPNTTYAAAPLAVYAALGLLQGVVGGAGGLAVVILLLAVVQLVAVGAVLLSEAGAVALPELKSKSSSPASGPSPRPAQPQAGQFGHPGPQGQPVQRPVPAPPQPPWGQNHTGPQPPVGWNPPSGGQPAGQSGQPGQPGQQNQSGPRAPAQGQAGQQDQQGAVQGPQGTQQMPHPASSSEQQRGF